MTKSGLLILLLVLILVPGCYPNMAHQTGNDSTNQGASTFHIHIDGPIGILPPKELHLHPDWSEVTKDFNVTDEEVSYDAPWPILHIKVEARGFPANTCYIARYSDKINVEIVVPHEMSVHTDGRIMEQSQEFSIVPVSAGDVWNSGTRGEAQVSLPKNVYEVARVKFEACKEFSVPLN